MKWVLGSMVSGGGGGGWVGGSGVGCTVCLNTELAESRGCHGLRAATRGGVAHIPIKGSERFVMA